MTERLALLALEDGALFPGRAVGAAGEATGEVVFNTAMTGYQGDPYRSLSTRGSWCV